MARKQVPPAREPLATLERIRETIGEMNFAAQYQQRPGPAGGGMIKAAWFQRFSLEDRPQAFDRIIQSWDTANKPSELSDYSVCTTWGLKGPHFYLLDILRKKLSYPELKRAVIEQDSLFHPEAILIEDRASGTQLIQELIAAGCSRATRFAPEGDKVMRLQAQTATIEKGFVWLPEAAPWLADYLAELTTFSRRPPRRPSRLDRPGARLDEAEAGGSGGMDRVLWEAGGVEAIGLQVVTIQYWRPELRCREGAGSRPTGVARQHALPARSGPPIFKSV